VGASNFVAERIRVGMCNRLNFSRLDPCPRSARRRSRDADWVLLEPAISVSEAPSNKSLERTRDR
jgi:hypothetical protein